MLRFVFTFTAIAVLAFGISGQAHASSLLGEFNALIFGDATHSNTDVEGRYAIGGHAVLSNFGVGSALSNSNATRDDLVVGGNLNFTNGQIHHGNVVVGGNATLSNFGIPNGNLTAGGTISTVNGGVGGVITPGSPSFDFAAAALQAQTDSAALAGFQANGSYSRTGNQVTLSHTGSGPNVFNVTAAELAGMSDFTLSVVDGPTLINVSGTSINWDNFGFFNFDPTQVLFNFHEATSITLGNSIGVKGSFLAPWAHVQSGYNSFDGQLVANSYNGNGEFHNFSFNGDFTPPHIVPTPAAGLAGFVMLTGMLVVRRLRAALVV